ncbi:MAG TPA: hypothetical protein VGY54_15415 [Polyangiaceae bacterium]|jgi:hypothetical protein|nr:hypothetical protein [Polyangiaceae bacterium]
MLGWVLGGLTVVGAAAVFFRGRMYRRLFSDEHFIEIGRSGAGLKAAALESATDGVADGMRGPSDPRMLVTSAGLAIAYTVHKNDLEFIHHCSVGVSGDITAHGVGATFVAFAITLVGLPIHKARFQVGESTVHHAEATLSAEEHEKMARAAVPEVSGANVVEFRRAALAMRGAITWTALRPSPRPSSQA